MALSLTLESVAKMVSIAVGSMAVAKAIGTSALPWIWSTIASRTISHSTGANLYTPAQLRNSLKNYIAPECQDVDPTPQFSDQSDGTESMVNQSRRPLFKALDDAFSEQEDHRYFLLLADSGMGKTSALINYCIRHIRRLVRRYKLVVLPLNIPDVDARIQAIPSKEKTILLLDALDEDTLAIIDSRERVRLLVANTYEFRKVLISCRTQLFDRDEEIPARTGRRVIGSRRAGQSAEHRFKKIYLAPFSPDQIEAYIRARYPRWKWRKRWAARAIVRKAPSIAARPMLLAHIDSLVVTGKSIRYSHQVYQEMIHAWVMREDGFVDAPEELFRVSQLLAVDIYNKRNERGSERIPRDDLLKLLREWNLPIEDWVVSSRSLLNRDADGNMRFAHRSVMEYLYVESALAGNRDCDVPWTDEMLALLRERIADPEFSIANRATFERALRWVGAKADKVGSGIELLEWYFSEYGNLSIFKYRTDGSGRSIYIRGVSGFTEDELEQHKHVFENDRHLRGWTIRKFEFGSDGHLLKNSTVSFLENAENGEIDVPDCEEQEPGRHKFMTKNHPWLRKAITDRFRESAKDSATGRTVFHYSSSPAMVAVVSRSDDDVLITLHALKGKLSWPDHEIIRRIMSWEGADEV